MSLMLLILFFITFLMFYYSYLFSVMFLVFLIIIMTMFWVANFMYVKFLIVLVYVSGVVVFMLYISCMCWYSNNKMSIWFLLGLIVMFMLWDSGVFSKFSEMGEFMWMYFFFAFLFNILVTQYSKNLFKVSGSLRF